jgi:hypothetical protein
MRLNHVFLRYRQEDIHVLAFVVARGQGGKIIHDLVNGEGSLAVQLKLHSLCQFLAGHAGHFNDAGGYGGIASDRGHRRLRTQTLL